MEALFVRLKPFDPQKRHVLKRYVYRGIRFHEERGWYRVPLDVADYLRGVRQVVHDPNSPQAFDVVTPEDAEKLDDAELNQAAARHIAARDVVMSVARDDHTDASRAAPVRVRKEI